LYDAYVERIYRYIYFRVAGHACAEDITSQVFLKGWEKLDTYQTEIARQLGKQRGAVRALQMRALQRLAKFLELEVEQVYGR
jgi:DNA-directed RNA polymerase specialized sigma24 family protein